MKKKYKFIKSSIIGILLICMMTNFLPTTSAGIIFNLNSIADISWEGKEEDKPIEINYQSDKISLAIDYKITKGLLGRRIMNFLSDKTTYVYINIVDHSHWIIPILETDAIPMKITDKNQPSEYTKIYFENIDNIPAYEEGYITIGAFVRRIGIIKGFYETYKIKIISGFNPIIQYKLPQGTFHTISPYTAKQIPIKFTNSGNAVAKISIEVINTSDSFDLSFSEVSINPNTTQTTYFIVMADDNFNEEKITLKLTPYSKDNPEDKGESKLFHFFIKNDGSRKEPKFPINVNILMIIIAIIIIILLMIILIVVAVRRKK